MFHRPMNLSASKMNINKIFDLAIQENHPNVSYVISIEATDAEGNPAYAANFKTLKNDSYQVITLILKKDLKESQFSYKQKSVFH